MASGLSETLSVISSQLSEYLPTNTDLIHFYRTAHFLYDASTETRNARKLQQLISYAFHADPIAIQQFSEKTDITPQMLLTKAGFQEGYHSKKHKQFICFRHWTAASPVQAAALSLDNFLLIQLLDRLVTDDQRSAAAQQLDNILKRMQLDHATATSAAAEASPVPHHNERKEAAEKTHTIADFAEYGAPIKQLTKAYLNYLNQYDALKDTSSLDALWREICVCLQKLPQYILQELFKDKSWADDPDFKIEPPRSPLCYPSRRKPPASTPLDLDLLDGTLGLGLVKASNMIRLSASVGGRAWVQLDCDAMGRLYEHRLAELKNIIHHLRTPKVAPGHP